jgi:hypothetical protein
MTVKTHEEHQSLISSSIFEIHTELDKILIPIVEGIALFSVFI